jgi:hypothetical protein
MTEENNKEPTPSVDEEKAERQRFAAQALMNHFNGHPDCVIVCSMSNGVINANVTPSATVGDILFMGKILQKYVDEAFEQVILKGRRMQKEAESQT